MFHDFSRSDYRPDYRPDPWRVSHADPEDRVAHLVFVDGRLVESWHEPVIGTPWQDHADRFDREAAPPRPAPDPPYSRVLAWLAESCGGAEAVAALAGQPLLDDGLDLPEVADPAHRERLEAVAALLDAVAERLFEPEMAFALRRALLLVWAEDPEVVAAPRSAALVAGGVCWAVGKANGCFAPVGALRVGRVQDALALSTSLSAQGQRIRSALWGFRSLASDGFGTLRAPDAPDLLSLGHPDLLLGATRERLLRLRDRAWQARDLAA
ncbi:MAG: hypothetical protein H7233_10890 [Pseudorhodobacter sp.]|nr:hypothetical protein [Frankiaceae bacterium]